MANKALHRRQFRYATLLPVVFALGRRDNDFFVATEEWE
jgi:hypothetical protein